MVVMVMIGDTSRPPQWSFAPALVRPTRAEVPRRPGDNESGRAGDEVRCLAEVKGGRQ